MYRSNLISSFSSKDEDKHVVLSGWVDTIRDHGSLVFVDLRDVSGKIQLVITTKDLNKIRPEFVIRVEGLIKKRDKDKINSNLPNGDIELECSKLEILNKSLPLPFDIGDDSIGELLKFKYRYLSLRNETNLNKLKQRSELMNTIRNFLHNKNCLEVDTPILTKSTPEGARDFLVPSRINDNKFYALPQSPQIFKQLLMVAGIDKYFQIARCFRDEDLRADRQPEFTQVDIELSFVNENDVMGLAEDLIKVVMKKFANLDLDPIRRMTYSDAMNFYGSDKPDTSFEMLITDVSDIAKKTNFKVFSDAKSVKAICLNKNISRKEIDDLTEKVKLYGAKGLAWIKITEEGYNSVISKFLTNSELDALSKRLNAKLNDTMFFVADSLEVANTSLGAIRLELANMFGLKNKKFNFLWVTDFPQFEYCEEEKRYKSVHHPFTASKGDFSKAYDLVLNGQEIGGGSIRIHDAEEQLRVFEKLGMSKEQAESQFEHLLTALRFGAPPHGGIAFGFDRLLTCLTGDSSIREVIPFPKTQRGICLLTDAPSDVEDKALNELKIKKVIKNDKKSD